MLLDKQGKIQHVQESSGAIDLTNMIDIWTNLHHKQRDVPNLKTKVIRLECRQRIRLSVVRFVTAPLLSRVVAKLYAKPQFSHFLIGKHDE
jgi:hypothetical protein